MKKVHVPFLDIPAINASLRNELDLAWKAVVDHGRFVNGPEVTEFEADFAGYCEAANCVGVANGTDALELILAGLGFGPGDEVIVPTNTFVATAEAVVAVGARPVFVDVLPNTLLIDPAAVADAVGPSTVAIMAVHLFGQMVEMDRLAPIARKHGLALIEDAAQAHGARYGGARAGNVGMAAAFSFYPGKNLGALGDGGAVVSDDSALIERIRSLADHGRSAINRHHHDLAGRNSRLDSIQAAALSAKLRTLDAANSRRRALVEHYQRALPVEAPLLDVHPLAEPVYHLAVVQVEDRERVSSALTDAGIGWGIHYPVPCHKQPAFADTERRFVLPVAEQAADRILSLPLSPTLNPDEVDLVAAVVSRAAGASR
jgi:dTDP-4-amino-4,6-dideoxygalactose transaminase